MRTNLTGQTSAPIADAGALGPSRSYQRSPSYPLLHDWRVNLSAFALVLVAFLGWVAGYHVGWKDRALLDTVCSKCIEEPIKPEGGFPLQYIPVNSAGQHTGYNAL